MKKWKKALIMVVCSMSVLLFTACEDDFDKAVNKAKESNSEYQESQQEIEDLQKELDETQKQIDELEKKQGK